MTRKIESRQPARRIFVSLASTLAALTFAVAFISPAHALTVQEQGWQVANSKCKGGDAKHRRDAACGAGPTVDHAVV